MQTVAADRSADRTHKVGARTGRVTGKARHTAGKVAQEATAKPVRKVRQEVEVIEARVLVAWIAALVERLVDWLIWMAGEAIESVVRWMEQEERPPEAAEGRRTPHRS